MNQPHEHDLPPARHRLLKEHLMTEIRREERVERVERQEREEPQRCRRWLRPALVAAAVAAVAAIAVTVAVPSGDAAQPQASREATALLGHIALAAEHEKAPAGVRDDQFVYIESRVAGLVYENGGPGRLQPVHEREIWLSVDGTRKGLLEEDAPDNGHVVLGPKNKKADERADTYYRDLAKLPTGTGAMRDWLYRVSAGEVDAERPDRDAAAFTFFGDLIRESLMPPKASAALYRAAATIPGVEVVHGVKDLTGREGVAITRGSGTERVQLIFDERTYAFLGEREYRDGTSAGGSAILRRAVVDKAGERP
ncbi:CU044_5270 family protein [Streptomyces sp. NPDC048278]|uniref:CU044_5270 family protein n=1 Tax=Streptomyces sp. NPDC048278 TaxID=3155809 RepID=UPI0034163C15